MQCMESNCIDCSSPTWTCIKCKPEFLLIIHKTIAGGKYLECLDRRQNCKVFNEVTQLCEECIPETKKLMQGALWVCEYPTTRYFWYFLGAFALTAVILLSIGLYFMIRGIRAKSKLKTTLGILAAGNFDRLLKNGTLDFVSKASGGKLEEGKPRERFYGPSDPKPTESKKILNDLPSEERKVIIDSPLRPPPDAPPRRASRAVDSIFKRNTQTNFDPNS